MNGYAFYPGCDASGAWRNRLVRVHQRGLDNASIETVREGQRAYPELRFAASVARAALTALATAHASDRLPAGHPTRSAR
ncbi:hypothetical protein B1759_15100 [Rubrivirga sp. SAORIC476]|uniref:hypothetical protein n=1 Tax=Rubrivirga sp. SAORIC476 TaxID=1961794 RepID=UPI000BA9A8EE|nr:hypothetical protein [Rubrivirga sp. SAORIC476]PAP79644.1 hypothetical protein B1759_15100 [Rubrivirga sp. SAORIC476]